MRHSLRWRLMLGFGIGLTLILIAGGAVIYLKIQKRLYNEFDQELVLRAETLRSMAEEDEDGTIQSEWSERGYEEPPGYREGEDYYELWDAVSGELYFSSENLLSKRLRRSELPEDGTVHPLTLPRGHKGRGLILRFRPLVDVMDGEEVIATREGRELLFVVAKRDRVVDSLNRLRNLLVILWLGEMVIGGFGIWWLVDLSLRPMVDLRRQIGQLKDTVAGSRIVLRGQPLELAPVTKELNRLLERVEGALARERNLTSNVAHELRTPIAGLLSNLEVILSRPRSGAEYRESGEECLEIAKRMHWLVNNLLSLTRFESGSTPLRSQDVDLGESLQMWWETFAERAEERRLRVEWNLAAEARVATDPEFLRVVVSNLFDNAVSYTPEGGTIRVSTDKTGRLVVCNDAVGLSEAETRQFFDAFWRKSEEREGELTHAGLGLSICQKVMNALGGRISARLVEGTDWLEVVLDWGPSKADAAA